MAMLSLGDMLAKNADLQPKPFKIRSARIRNRAAAWRYDLEQWRQYRLAMARTDAERADIEREYEQRSAAGPDFTGYHAKSRFQRAARPRPRPRRPAGDPDGVRPGPRLVVAEHPQATTARP